jgi:hypothetical protein
MVKMYENMVTHLQNTWSNIVKTYGQQSSQKHGQTSSNNMSHIKTLSNMVKNMVKHHQHIWSTLGAVKSMEWYDDADVDDNAGDDDADTDVDDDADVQ